RAGHPASHVHTTESPRKAPEGAVLATGSVGEQARPGNTGGWISWVLGVALLAAVIAGALRFSEERAFVRLAEHATPWWLAVAVALQAGTYAAQGAIWRRVAALSGNALSW